MVKIQKPKKQKLSNKKIKKTVKRIKNKPHNSEKPTVPESEPGSSDSDFDTETLSELLEHYTRDQLINLISAVSLENSSFLSFVRLYAGSDAAHRKLFVHNLAWDTTRESLASAFEPFGEIEDCNVIVDKATGKCKGYGFVLFKERKSASKALKEPKKKINYRITSCQLASVGPISAAKDSDQTHHKKPADVKNKNVAEPAVLFPPQPQVLAATQNFPLLGHSNPIYGSLLGSQISPVTPLGATSKMAVTAVPSAATSYVGVVGGAFGRENSSLLGQYGAGQGLQYLYPNMQIEQQPGTRRGQGKTTTGAFSGYPSYIWYQTLLPLQARKNN
ncbi:UBP1-associated proteins 1A-like isoform X2 [Herrania umbratica]|uniref:UBP1-associated proteins 1A-like isoform X2 n=1 Tax=Herrania umbratica TaxID=108875 RepID=A0A6J0ZFM2_9ROSI|nr:UBP1-associated proteins 1A-like isoform X2 [Herrania umbratica]